MFNKYKTVDVPEGFFSDEYQSAGTESPQAFNFDELPDWTPSSSGTKDTSKAIPNDAGRLQTGASEFLSGVASVVSSVPKQAAIVSADAKNRYRGELSEDERTALSDLLGVKLNSYDPEDPSDNVLYKAGDAFDEFVGGLLDKNEDYKDDFWTSTIPNAFGQMTGFMLSGGPIKAGMQKLTGAVTGKATQKVSGVVGNAAAAGVAGMTVASVAGFEDAIREGATLDEAFDSSNWNAAVGATEGVPLANMIKRANKVTNGRVRNAIEDAIMSGTEEAIQESVSSILSNLIASDVVKYDPERGVWSGVDEGAAVGFTTGFLMQSLMSLVGGRRGGTTRADVSEDPNGDALSESVNQQTQPVPEEAVQSQTKGSNAFDADTVFDISDESEVGTEAEAEYVPGEEGRIDLEDTDGDVSEIQASQGIPTQDIETENADHQLDEQLTEAVPTQSTPFTPTHEMPNGELVMAVEDEPGVYVDRDGAEWEEPNAKPYENQRSQSALRETIDNMPPDERHQTIAELRSQTEEMQKRLYTNPVSGIPNREAYIDAPKKAFVAAIDVDSLKWLNDNMGHAAGDELLKAVGEALQQAGIDSYHISGDEFVAQSDNDQDLTSRLAQAAEILGDLDIEIELPDGQIIKSTQAGFSYGIGRDLSEAEDGLRGNKDERQKQGLRAERGGEPSGVVRTTAQGNQSESSEPSQQAEEISETTKGIEGATDKAFTPDNKTVDVQYVVLESDDLVTSNDENGNVNPNFPQALQPRDRSGKKSQAQINDIVSKFNPERLGVTNSVTDGAPIIGDGNVVESGNGRTLAIRKAYKGAGGVKYRKWLLDNAEAFGMNRDDIKAMKRPVLVRRRLTPMNDQERQQFTLDANTRTNAGLSALEAAKTDAALINDGMMEAFSPSADGNVLATSNSQFLRLFSQAIGTNDASGLMSGTGQWTRQMADRVQAAVFHKAYGNDRLTELLAQDADPVVKNIINALNVAAPHFARLKTQAIEEGLDLAWTISDATAIILQAKNGGLSVADLIKQAGLFGDLDPIASKMAVFMDAYSRSAKMMATLFVEAAEAVSDELNQRSSIDMFDRVPSNINDILARAAESVEVKNERQQEAADLFGQEERPGDKPDNATSSVSGQQGPSRRSADEVGSHSESTGVQNQGIDQPDTLSPRDFPRNYTISTDAGPVEVKASINITPESYAKTYGKDGAIISLELKGDALDSSTGYKSVAGIVFEGELRSDTIKELVESVVDEHKIVPDPPKKKSAPKTRSTTKNSGASQESKPVSPEYEKAQADLDAALGDLGEIFRSSNLLSSKAKPTDLNASDLLPVLTRVMDASFRMGYAKFKENARFVVNTIRDRFGDAAADSISIDELQGAYIAMKKGTDSKLDVISVESLDEIMAEDSIAANQSLADTLYQSLDGITDNRKLKRAVAAWAKVSEVNVTAEQMKQAQEALELALVRKAREIVEQGADVETTYKALLAMYQSQPNLNMRSSTSMENQAYSTPAPLAYLAADLAGANQQGVSVYEPTAGNGMLLITTNPENAIVNELNDDRASQLRDIGFTVTQNDAATYAPVGQVDSLVMNPPFAPIKATDYDGYKLKAIDHLITAKSLEAMKDNGKAAIIIGANKVAGEIKPAERTFFNWLYSNYNVVDHFEIDGDLYRRQGAGWPVRVIAVNGRQASKQISPKSGTIERVENWDQVYERYTESVDASRSQPVSTESVNDGDGYAVASDGRLENTNNAPEQDQATADRGRGNRPAAANSGGNTGRNRGDNDGAGSRSNGRTDSDARISRDTNQSNRLQQESATKPTGQSTTPRANATVVDRGFEQRPGSNVSDAAGSNYQAPYTTYSKGSNEAVLTPANMAQSTSKSLAHIQSEVGDLDSYVMDKLGYESLDHVYDAFMGLQIDTIAAAIYNTENGEKGIIIADQTGVGKGRQAAGIIRYAKRQGKIPVFITVKPNLFTDMYNDLRDIGSDDVVPFIMNREESIKDGKNKLFANQGPAKHRAALREIINTGELPGDANALFLTYSQLNMPNIQREVIDALKGKAYFVMDEAHNAAGDRIRVKKGGVKQVTTAGFIYEVIAESPVTYLSATYAKRPDNIPVYYRTDLLDAVDTIDELVTAVSEGGAALQTVMSGMLAEAGQLFRRERSFDGIEVITSVDTDNTAEHTEFADKVTTGLRAITMADSAFHNITVKFMQEAAEATGGAARGAGNRASSSIDHTNFTSVVHNFISQLLLGLKARRAADMAIELHKKGVKPVIALENTMGAFLKQYAAETGASIGDEVNADYRDILHRALDRTRRISVTDATGRQTTVEVPLSKIDPYVRSLYKDAFDTIESLDIGMLPISPIDYVRSELTKAGISVAEITGREYRLDYATPTPTLAMRDSKEIKDRRATVDSFNNGDLDALILNAAGSTGLSIHASEKFTDQKPRHMIVMQAMADINILMQMLGRINRTGQVELPKYTMMGLDIPAEKRPLARTANKMKSLNANTSANTESDTSVKAADIMNKYGDKVVSEFLAENPEVAHKVDISTSSEGAAVPGLAMKFTGRLALLPVKEQLEIYEQIEAAYTDLIDYLNKTNQNDLEPRVIDLDAKIISTEVIYEGKNPESIFGGNTYLHKVDAKYQGKPPTPEEVAKALDKVADPQTQAKAIIDAKAADKQYEQRVQADLVEANSDLAKANAELAAIPDTDENEAQRKKAEKKVGDLGAQVVSLSNRMESLSIDKRRIEGMIDTFTVGNRVRLSLDGETVNAVVVNIKDSHKAGKGNPYAASKVRVSFMVNNGIRTIDLPLTQLESTRGIFIEQLQSKGKEGLDKFFDMSDLLGDRRENRYIATGNLIAGSASLKGRINSFTDSEGNTHLGILMPKSFAEDAKANIKAVTGDTFIMRDAKVMAKFLRGLGDLKPDIIKSSDDAVTIYRQSDGRGWAINIPKANTMQSVRAVKFDDKLRAAMGSDFFGSSKTMTARFSDAKLPAVLEQLTGLVKMQAESSMRDAWTRAGGNPKAEAITSFDARPQPLPKPTIRSMGITSQVEGNGSELGISKDKAQAIADDFIASFNGNIPLNIRVANTQEELYGPEATKENVGTIKGAYHPATGVFTLAASNLSSAQDAREVLRHEILGHYGLNTFSPADKKSLLEKIIAARSEPSLQDIWSDVDRTYTDLTEIQKAEEVFAFAVERESPSLKQFLDNLYSMIRKALQAIGIGKGLVTRGELRRLSKVMAEQIRSGDRQQQTFPKTDQEQFSRADNPPTELGSNGQETRLEKAIKDGAPVDKLFQAAFGWSTKLTKPIYNGMEFALTKWDSNGRVPWLDSFIKSMRAGLIDRYGLSDEYLKRDMRRENQQTEIMNKGIDILQALARTDMSIEESQVLQAVLTGEQVSNDKWSKVAEPIRLAIDDLGREAVLLGLLDESVYQKNRGAYLHRTYLKYEMNESGAVGFFSRGINTFRKNINGRSLKGRGMDKKVDAEKLRTFDQEWWGKTSDKAKFDEQLQGRKYIVLTRVSGRDTSTPTLAGVEQGARKGKNRETIYWPTDKKMPDKYLEWDNRGTFEVVGRKAGKIVLWRDFTKSERVKMGEILDARYNIAKTFHIMSHDLANGRFLKDIAQNDEWTWNGEGEPGGVIASAREGGYGSYGQFDWVLVPDSIIPKTNKKRWGVLAGKYVRAEIWSDLNQQDQMLRSTVWRKALTQWKLNKTARNPVVHMNNVMSNLVFMDMADVRGRDLYLAVDAIRNGTQDYKDALNSGAFGGGYVEQEIRRDLFEPILKELSEQAKDDKGTFESLMGTSGALVDGIFKGLKAIDDSMLKAYQMEDTIFRMATYLRRKGMGDDTESAAMYARDQFLNYDIRAPYINAMRNTVLPFLSYTYRAAPVIAKSIAERPWKLGKYMTVAWAINAMGYMLAPGDEEEERKAMRDEETGSTWLMVPRMIRMPWRDSDDNPVFLDVRRWLPAGDIFDTNQGQAPVPVPSWLQFGGPLMLAFELTLNKQAFTGEEISNEFDSTSEQFKNVAGWAYRSWMPSAPYIPGSWYWDGINRAWDGASDYYGRQYSLPQAVSSSIGIKARGLDVEQGLSRKAFELSLRQRAARKQLSDAARLYNRGVMKESEYNREVKSVEEKMQRIKEEAQSLR